MKSEFGILPPEILKEITKWVEISDYLNLKRTCKIISSKLDPSHILLTFSSFQRSIEILFKNNTVLNKVSNLAKSIYLDRETERESLHKAVELTLPLPIALKTTCLRLDLSTCFFNQKEFDFLSKFQLCQQLDWFLENVVSKNLQDGIDFSKFGNAAFRAAVAAANLNLCNKLLKVIEPSNHLLLQACSLGHLEVVKLLVNDNRVDPACQSNLPLRLACARGSNSILEFLLDCRSGKIDPSDNDNDAILLASMNGHASTVMLLLESAPQVNPADQDNWAISFAARNGHLEVVEALLRDKRVDPSACSNEAIISASRSGHTDIVRRLLREPKVNPADCGNEAVRDAFTNGQAGTLALLMADPRVDPAALEGLSAGETTQAPQDSLGTILLMRMMRL